MKCIHHELNNLIGQFECTMAQTITACIHITPEVNNGDSNSKLITD